MYKGKRIVALIPARGGSKSIPKKNITKLGGKPLLAWSIEVAQKMDIIDKVIVSTDDKDISEIARKLGGEVSLRPLKLATDTSLIIDTIKYEINLLKQNDELDDEDLLLLLEPTCPFREVADIQKCIDLIIDNELDTVATYKEAELNPHRAWLISKTHEATPFIENVNPWLPRQKLPSAFQLNGAVYVLKVKSLKENEQRVVFGKSGAIVMPRERSIDIDNPIDLIVAEAILNESKK